MRLSSLLGAVAVLFVASAAGATPPNALAPRPVVGAKAPPPAPHVVTPRHDPGVAPVPASPLFAPKRVEEAPEAFFSRAAQEVGRTPAIRTPAGHDTVETLARAAGYEAIRNVVVGGGVVGSQSGNSYVLYYKHGWDDANLYAPAPAPKNATTAETPPPAPPPVAHRDPQLESDVRTMLSRTPDGRTALEHLEHAKTAILFREGGGTSNNGDEHELYVDTKMMDGKNKPVSWLALSVAHEASHAHDDATGATPRTISALRDQYAQKKAETSVPQTLRIALVNDRADYVDRQVAGEARAMTTETRLRHDLEAQGVDFAGLNTKLLDPYNQAYAKVYAAAGVTLP